MDYPLLKELSRILALFVNKCKLTRKPVFEALSMSKSVKRRAAIEGNNGWLCSPD